MDKYNTQYAEHCLLHLKRLLTSGTSFLFFTVGSYMSMYGWLAGTPSKSCSIDAYVHWSFLQKNILLPLGIEPGVAMITIWPLRPLGYSATPYKWYTFERVAKFLEFEK